MRKNRPLYHHALLAIILLTISGLAVDLVSNGAVLAALGKAISLPDPVHIGLFGQQRSRLLPNEDPASMQLNTNGKVVFSSNRTGNVFKVYTMNADGSGVTCLMCGAGDTRTGRVPAVSPDGNKIAYVDNGTIHLMKSSDGTHLLSLAPGSSPAWSPDGTRLVFTRFFPDATPAHNRIFIINADGSGETQVTAGPESTTVPTWGAVVPGAPQGRIAFTTLPQDTSDIFVIAPTTTGSAAFATAPRVNVTNNAGSDYDPDWSPDGLKLVFQSDRGQTGNGNIYTVQLDPSQGNAGPVTRITNAPTTHQSAPAWAPDGTKIVYASIQSGSQEIFVIDAANGSPAPGNITNNAATDFDADWGAAPVPTVTNGRIYFASTRVNSRYKIFSIMENGQGLTCVGMCSGVSDPAGVGSTDPSTGRKPAVSPDGTKIAYVDTGVIKIMNSDGSGTPVTLATGDDPQWSPDGANIVFNRNTAATGPSSFDIFIINADGTGEFNMSNNAADDRQPSWGAPSESYPKGRIAWTSNRAGTYDIWVNFPHAPISNLQNAFTNAPAVNASNAHASRDANPSWSPDGSRLAIVSDRDDPSSEVYTMGIDEGFGSLTRITSDPKSDETPIWSPDGKRVAWARYMGNDGQNYEIFVQALTDPIPVPNPYNLTQNSADDRYPTWAAEPAASATVDLVMESMTDSSNFVARGSNFSYDFTYRNIGGAKATGVKIIFDPIPNNVRVHGIMTNCIMAGDRKVTCTYPDLSAGAVTSQSVTFAADELGGVNVKATVSANEPDINESNNFLTQSTKIVTSADVGVIFSPDLPNAAYVGQTVTFSARVTNSGPDVAKGVTFVGSIGSGFDSVTVTSGQLCIVSGSTVTCPLGNIDSGPGDATSGPSVKVVTFTAVARNEGAAPVNIGVGVDGTETIDPYAPNNNRSATVTVGGTPADLSLAVAYSPNVSTNSVRVGNQFSVYFTVVNNGPATATNVVILYTTAPGVRKISTLTDSRCQTTSNGEGQILFVCSVGNISPGGSVNHLGITLRADKAGAREETASVVANEPDSVTANNSALVKVTVQRPAFEMLGLEVTQAVQDLENSVPLVADKKTIVRAFVRGSDDSIGVRSRGKLIGTHSAGVTDASLTPANTGEVVIVTNDPKRNILNDAFYFELPADWIKAGTLQLKFETPGADLTCAEPDATPNCIVNVTFRETDPLSIKFISMTYTDRAGVTHTPTYTPEVQQVVDEFLARYPISRIDGILGFATTTLDPCTRGGTNFPAIRNELRAIRDTECKTGTCYRYYQGLLADQLTPNCYLSPAAGPPPLAGTINGQGDLPGNVSAAFTVTDDTMPRIHEQGHVLGFAHTDYSGDGRSGDETCGDTAGNRVACSQLDGDGTLSLKKVQFDPQTAYGWDLKSSEIYRAEAADYMSYGRPRWVSRASYVSLFNIFRKAGSEPHELLSIEAENTVSATQTVQVMGSVRLDGSGGSLDSIYVAQSPGTVALPPSGTYALRLEDAQGAQIASYSFDPVLGPDDISTGLVSLQLPWDPSAKRISLLRNGQLLATRTASPTAPTVTITYPNGGEILGNSAVFNWTANDLDGDTLTYMVEISKDNGSTWSPITFNWKSTNFPVDLTKVPGSSQSLLRVTASDGFNAGEDQSNTVFTIPSKTPYTVISTPETGRIYVGEQVVNLVGSALDVDEGKLLSASNLTWTSSLNGPLGSGGSLSVNAALLAEGVHTLTLTAADASGQQGTATTTIQVFRVAPVFPAALSVDVTPLSFSGSSLTPPETLAIRNSGDGELNWSASADQPWIKLGAATGEAPTNLEVRADPTGLTLGTYSGKITVSAGEGANSPKVVDVTLVVVPGPPLKAEGRVLTPSGRGLSNAAVTIVDSDGAVRKTFTSSLGYFSFPDLPTGKQYTVRVTSKRFRFTPRTMVLSNNITFEDFVGVE